MNKSLNFLHFNSISLVVIVVYSTTAPCRLCFCCKERCVLHPCDEVYRNLSVLGIWPEECIAVT